MRYVSLGFCLGIFVGVSPLGYVAVSASLPISVTLLVVVGCALGLGLGNGAPADWRIASRLGVGASLLRFAAVAFLLGGVHACMATQRALDERLPLCADDQFRELTILIVDPPVVLPGNGSTQQPAARFRARVDGAAPASFAGVAATAGATGAAVESAGDCQGLLGRELRLTWYDPPPLAVAERWQVTARIRPPWSYQNPAGFDYERWLLGERFAGTGYIREGALVRSGAVGSARSGFDAWLESRGARHRGILLALAEGDSSKLTTQQWQWLRVSGTVHLLVISGLHISIVTAVLFTLGLAAARLYPPLVLRCEARRVASLIAIAGSAAFVVHTGSGVPAIRAWVMSTLLLLSLATGHRHSLFLIYLAGMASVLLLYPLALHQQGFWLSFAAVGVLLAWYAPRAPIRHWVAQLATTQWLLFIALTPVLATRQLEIPGAGVLVNLLAVPLVTVLALPGLLLVAAAHDVFPVAAGWGLAGVELVLDGVLFAVRHAAALPTWLVAKLGVVGLCGTLAAAYFLLGGHDWRWRLIALVTWCAWLAPVSSGVPHGHVRVTVLDVGQGSAILVDTRSHRLVFDAGPRYPGGFDLGASAVLPSLVATGPPSIDMLVLSHADIDHRGGAAALLGALPVQEVAASFPLDAAGLGQLDPATARVAGSGDATKSAACRAGSGWIWDGVDFAFLHPSAADMRRSGSDNGRSCVLRIGTAAGSVLLGGDIDQRTERRLVRRFAGTEMLDVDVVTAPHHGSGGSSGQRWVEATSPAWVLISAPRRSRYGHPHPDVVARYEMRGARVFTTGLSGALTWQSWQAETVHRWREDEGGYWINRALNPETVSARPGAG